MVVRPSGGFHGTIGGGALEWRALEVARDAIREGRGTARRETMALGPDLGQCCGGRVDFQVEVYDASDLGRSRIARRDGSRRSRAARRCCCSAPAMSAARWRWRWRRCRSRSPGSIPDLRRFPAHTPRDFRLVASPDPPAELAKAPDGALGGRHDPFPPARPRDRLGGAAPESLCLCRPHRLGDETRPLREPDAKGRDCPIRRCAGWSARSEFRAFPARRRPLSRLPSRHNCCFPSSPRRAAERKIFRLPRAGDSTKPVNGGRR